jgi:mono/diheme cytochrome c family protein
MGTVTNQILAILFVVISTAATFLMFYLWGFPFDKEKLRSTAPRGLMLLHRLLGYGYLAIYVYLMWQMLPRMWSYQVQLPARTVAHLVLGMAIGATLIVKIVVVRFFKHLESTLIPALGTFLFIATVLLIGLALPFSLRETFLQRAALRGEVFGEDRQERVRTFLPLAGLDDEARIARLSSRQGLLDGRRVLQSKCIQCHDLRTVLARPRTPDAWRETVRRMAARSTILNPIAESEQWEVTAYLIAITPTLQRTVQLLRQQELQSAETEEAAAAASNMVSVVAYDSAAAGALFRSHCSQCHSPDRVAGNPPASQEEATLLVQRMVTNGLRATEEELVQLIRYLTETYVRQ